MNYTEILKRSWQITWRHKALWFFGFLLALFGGGGGTGGGRGAQYTFKGGEQMPSRMNLALVGLIAILGLFLVLLGLVLRYVSVGALVGMVSEAEDTGRTSLRSGWRIGGSHFLRVLGIDLLLGLPFAILSAIAVGIGLSPLLLLSAQRDALTVLAVALTVVLMLGIVLLLAVLGIAISIISILAHRQCVLEGKGVTDSIRSAYTLARRNVRQVGAVWLMLAAIGILLALIAIPVGAVFFALGSAPTVALYAVTESEVVTLMLGLLLAIPIVLALSALGGIHEAFRSAVWTIAYRELPYR